jgi:4-amino-4-deoxy-L-arabinose transferase-like glycosyltransferase
VAKKRRRKRSWLGTLLFLICIPLVVWFLAFLIWFYWNDINGLFGRRDKIPQAGKEVERSGKPSDKTAQERIGEEDRRKLEEILKSRK